MPNTASRFLALLRGINVGGTNVIDKHALQQCFHDLGLHDVRTYIQSGNILFRSNATSVTALTNAVEAQLSDRLAHPVRAVILPRARYVSAVRAAPDTWGKDDAQKHNALFVLRGATPRRILAQLPAPKTEIETVTAGPGIIFWSVSKTHLSKTTLMRLPAAPAYQHVTIRNHNTVFTLLKMLDEE